MKKLTILCLCLCVAGAVNATVITTDADTYVRGDSHTGNFGSVDYMRVKTSTGGAGSDYSRYGWVHFDLTGQPVAGEATLSLTYMPDPVGSNYATAGTITVWGIVDGQAGDALGTDWSELGITGLNAPVTVPYAEGAVTTELGTYEFTSPSDGDAFEFSGAALVDFLNADTNDEVTFLLTRNAQDQNFTFRTRENTAGGAPTLDIQVTQTAQAPDPDNGEKDVLPTVSLSWAIGNDPVTTAPRTDVTEYLVYLSAPNDPNLITVTGMPVAETGTGGGSYTPASELSRDAVYTWRVDEVLTDTSTITGKVWSFETVPSVPVITLEPVGDLVDADTPVSLTVAALNPFTGDDTGMTYQWYQNGTPVATGATYSIPSAQVVDEGEYVCGVTIISNGASSDSAFALVGVKREVANWTLDQADYVGGQYVDVVGGYNADPNCVTEGENPVFVDGWDASPTNAATMSPNSWASAGTWNPSEFSGQFTLSAWIKWDGSTIGTFGDGIICKAEAWGTETQMWYLALRGVTDGKAGIRFYNSGSTNQIYGAITPDVWTHVCATFDGSQFLIYVDGDLKGTSSAVSNNGTDTPIMIGNKTPAGDATFPGALDDISIYNYGLGAEAVATLYADYTGESTCLYPPALDYTGPEDIPDCVVDIYDFAHFASSWLECGLIPACL